MFVEQAGQPSTIPLFDETSAAVFACLCRLTDGDGRRALTLLIDVYVTTANESSTPHDLTAFTDRARRLYLADDRSPTAIERLIADMHFVEHRPSAAIARAWSRSRRSGWAPSWTRSLRRRLPTYGTTRSGSTTRRAEARRDRRPVTPHGRRFALSVRSRRRVGVIAAVGGRGRVDRARAVGTRRVRHRRYRVGANDPVDVEPGVNVDGTRTHDRRHGG